MLSTTNVIAFVLIVISKWLKHSDSALHHPSALPQGLFLLGHLLEIYDFFSH